MSLVDLNGVLQEWDRLAKAFEFPMLDNWNLELADAQLTAYRGNETWAVFFELVSFSKPEIEFVDYIYAYGSSCPNPGFQGERIILNPSPINPIIDPISNDCIADKSSWSVRIGDRTMSFAPSIEEYKDAGVSPSPAEGPGSINEADILRFLVHKLGHAFFATEGELMKSLSRQRELKQLLCTTRWQHPDLSNGELPSRNVCMRTLLSAISEDDENNFDEGIPNTHWSYWERE